MEGTNGTAEVKDFDVAREARRAGQAFRIGGEEFQMRAVRPEVLLAYQDFEEKPPPELVEARKAVLRASLTHPSDNGERSAEAQLAIMDADPLEEAFEQATNARLLPRLDEIVVNLTEPADDAHARYKALREREKDPITLGDLQSLVGWLLGTQAQALEVAAGRPTSPPSPSTPGPARTGAPSMGVSSLPAPPPGLRA